MQSVEKNCQVDIKYTKQKAILMASVMDTCMNVLNFTLFVFAINLKPHWPGRYRLTFVSSEL